MTSRRLPGPKCVTACTASSTLARSSRRFSTVIATEQQMSAEWKPGWMASLVATAPPTGMVPGCPPLGQASGITAAPTIVGTRSSASMWRATSRLFACSSGVSASRNIA